MISPASTNPAVTQKGDYIFRVCFIDPFQGTAMAKFAQAQLGMKKVAVLSCLTAPYSAGLAKYFKAQFTADGGAIAVEEKYSDGDKDFKAQLTAIKAADVDGIFVPGYYSEVGLICSQARELGITVPLMGGDGWEAPQLLTIGGAAVNGCYYTTHFSPQNTAALVQGFVALTIFTVVCLVHSTYGRGFLATHDDEIAAEAVGLNTTRYKIAAFVIGAFFAGIAGGLYGHFRLTIDPAGFDFTKSIEIVVMVILGGMGNTPGVILAAILLTLLPEVLRPIADYRMIIYSLLLIVLMIVRPQGLFNFSYRRTRV
jgi:hypothetical protein